MLTVLKKIADVGTFSAKPFDKIYTENIFSADLFFRKKTREILDLKLKCGWCRLFFIRKAKYFAN
jgi:hypothetical protein